MLAEKRYIFVIVYLDNILIYTKKTVWGYVKAVCWVFNQLHKNCLFAKLKKYHLYKNNTRFLSNVVSAKEVWMDVLKNCP